jgi:ATP/maltotriose-dependent transcriptional regulator MalT
MRGCTDHEIVNRQFSYTIAAPRPIVTSRVRTWHAAPVQVPAAVPSPLARLGLTDREQDVATLATAGYSYAQIAHKLFVARTTVGYHLSNIYAKCGVQSRHELTELVRNGVSMAGQH